MNCEQEQIVVKFVLLKLLLIVILLILTIWRLLRENKVTDTGVIVFTPCVVVLLSILAFTWNIEYIV